MVPQSSTKREVLLKLGQAGIVAVQPGPLTAERISQRFPEGRFHVLAIGKAAGGMMQAAATSLGDRLHDGILVGPDGADMPTFDRVACLAGEHPVPGSGSFAAGRAVHDWLVRMDDELPLLLLLSGGGSAMLELPVGGIEEADCVQVHRWCLGSGLPITQVNAVRSRFSALKSGGLAALAGDRDIHGLVLSDVPTDDPAFVASGPLSASLVEEFDSLEETLPAWLRELAGRAGETRRASAAVDILADNSVALAAIAALAAKGNIPVSHRGELAGLATDMAERVADDIRHAAPGLLIYGGETTVKLPESPGRGGRNQHLALSLASELAEVSGWCALALATDGVDGHSDDAGALVDGDTVIRGREAGMDAEAALAAADSGTFLEAIGDLVHTGPTGTNVMDILLVLKWAAE